MQMKAAGLIEQRKDWRPLCGKSASFTPNWYVASIHRAHLLDRGDVWRVKNAHMLSLAGFWQHVTVLYVLAYCVSGTV